MGFRAILSKYDEALKLWLRSSNFSQKALNAFFASGPAAIAILDPELRFVKANGKVSEMVGCPLAGIIGQTTRDVVPLLADKIDPIFRRVSLTGEPAANFTVTGETPKSRGLDRQWVASAFPIYRDATGHWYVGAMAVEVVDMTYFEKLRKREALLAEAEEIGHLGCWEHDLVTGEDNWSANLCQILGVDPAKTKLSEEFFWQLVHPDDHEAVRTVIEGGMKFGNEYEYQARLIQPGGRERTFYTYGRPILGLDNRVIKRVGLTQDISARVEVERALLKSEKSLSLFRELIDRTNDAIEVVDPATLRFLDVNQRMCSDLGYTHDELLQMTVYDIDPTLDEERAASVNVALKQSGSFIKESIHRRKDGSTFPVELNISLVQLDKSYVTVVVRDITERKRAEDLIRHERDRAQRYLDVADVILVALDLKGRITLINRKGCSTLEWEERDLLGRDWIETCLPARIRDDIRIKFHHLLEGDLSYVENPILTRYGGERVIAWRNTLLRDAGGRVTGTLSSGEDVTEKKLVQDALRESEARLRLATKAGRMYAYEWDVDTDIIARSEECKDVLGENEPARLTRGELLDTIYPEDRQKWESHTPTLDNPVSDEQYRMFRRDGSLIWVQKTTRAFFDEHGKTVRTVGMVVDITEHKRADDALHVLSTRLINLRDEERRRIAIEIHEGLAQNLVGLKMSLNHLRGLMDKGRDDVAGVLDECGDLIGMMLEDTRSLSYSLHPQLLENLGLPFAVASYARSLSARTGIDVAVEIDIPENKKRFSADYELAVFRLVQECLTNIHRHSGSQDARVQLSCDDQRLILEVADRGQGLNGSSVNGTSIKAVEGIGISSMRERVRQLDGSFQIGSNSGRGTKVRVVLPVANTSRKEPSEIERSA